MKLLFCFWVAVVVWSFLGQRDWLELCQERLCPFTLHISLTKISSLNWTMTKGLGWEASLKGTSDLLTHLLWECSRYIVLVRLFSSLVFHSFVRQAWYFLSKAKTKDDVSDSSGSWPVSHWKLEQHFGWTSLYVCFVPILFLDDSLIIVGEYSGLRGLLVSLVKPLLVHLFIKVKNE